MGLGFTDDLTGDGELGGIFAILAKQIRQKAAAGVDEPVADLGKQKRYYSQKKKKQQKKHHFLFETNF